MHLIHVLNAPLLRFCLRAQVLLIRSYAQIVSYAEITLAYAHQSFAQPHPYKGPLAKHEHRVQNVAHLVMHPSHHPLSP